MVGHMNSFSESPESDCPVPPEFTSNDHALHIAWKNVPAIQFNDRFTGKRVEGENVLIVCTEAQEGFIVPKHKHESEQISMIQCGSWHFNVAGNEFVAKAGDVVHIPAGWEHSAVALETTTVIEIFTPPRRDWSDEEEYLWGV
ncbi:MAG: cupin domain-containing protein [Acidobacteria bacterium]|nr:cupin domain-containing protein [Acidobacteriota bacterium]